MRAIVGVLCLFAAITVNGLCPHGGQVWGDYCFYASRGTFKYTDAYRACTAMTSGCLLLELNTTNEGAGSKHDMLLQYVGSISFSNVFWVGATDLLVEGTYVRAGTGLALAPFTWQSNQPDGTSNANCMAAQSSDLKAQDERCTDFNFYMCECPLT